jgi:hypothetical protein
MPAAVRWRFITKTPSKKARIDFQERWVSETKRQ